VIVNPGPPVAEGEVLAGKYRVEKVLGVGGMGVVVAATHTTLRQKVAIKFLLAGASDEVVQRFLREARAAVRLRSDHVARVIDVGELESGAPYMVMEYLAGSDLSAVLRDRGPLPVDEAVDYVLQACEAIAEAHVAGIVHRDLKPANLFLTKAPDGSPSVKVLDFGISKDTGGEAEDEHGLTKTTAVLGSPHYMAPEQMRSTRSVDGRADVWSLGVILFQLLTKSVPYKAPSFMELALKVLQEDAPAPTSRRAGLPAGLDAAILRCLRRDRDARFPNVAELAAAIAPYGGVDAARMAERIARTQGVTITKGADAQGGVDANASASPSGSTLRSEDARRVAEAAPPSTPAPAPMSSPPSSVAQLSTPAAVHTDAIAHAMSGARHTEPPPSATPGGKTTGAWTAGGDAQPGTPAPTRRPGLLFVGAAAGLVFGGIVAALVWTRAPRAAATPVAPVASVSAEPVLAPAASAAVGRSAPPPVVAASAAAPPVDSAPPVPSAEPSASPSASARATPQPARAADKPHAHAVPAATTPPKAGKKNPLDIDIQ
jgi:serine/threonine-protein kinase